MNHTRGKVQIGGSAGSYPICSLEQGVPNAYLNWYINADGPSREDALDDARFIQWCFHNVDDLMMVLLRSVAHSKHMATQRAALEGDPADWKMYLSAIEAWAYDRAMELARSYGVPMEGDW